MADFTGTDFLALDNSAVGDGTGGATRFLDTFTEHATLNNSLWLQSQRAGCSHTHWPGSQKLCSIDWTSWHRFFYPVDASTETLRIIVVTGLAYDGSLDFSGFMRVRDLHPQGPDGDERKEFIDTTGGGPTALTFELDYDAGGGDFMTLISVEMKTQIGDKQEEANMGVSSGYAEGVWSSYPEDMALFGQGASWPSFDVFRVVDEDGDGTIDDVVLGPGGAGRSADSPLFARHLIPYYTPKSIIVEEDQRRASTPIDSRQIRARIPYDAGYSSYPQAREVQKAYDEPRARLLGQSGDDKQINDPNTENANPWPDGRPERWGYLWEDAGSGQEVFRESIKLDLDSDVKDEHMLDIRWLQMGAHVIYYWSAPEDTGVQDLTGKLAGEIDFDLTFTVEEAGTSIASKTVSFTDQPMVPTDYQGRWPVLRQLQIMKYGKTDRSTSNNVPVIEERDRDELLYSRKEGQLWPRDFGLFRPQSLRLPVPRQNLVAPKTLIVTGEITTATYNADSDAQWLFEQKEIDGDVEEGAVLFDALSVFEKPV